MHTIEYNPDKINNYQKCQTCELKTIQNDENTKGCKYCNLLNKNTRKCDECYQNSYCVQFENITKGILILPFLPIVLVGVLYISVRNKCLGRHWSEGLIK